MIGEIKEKFGQFKIVRDASGIDLPVTPTMCLDIETFGENKKPGDSPYYENHGVAGISIGNMHGDGFYICVNDGKAYGGVPMQQAIDAVNRILSDPNVTTVLGHYFKFDLSFLKKRGLKIDHLRVIDTWLLRNICSKGNYTANKLKEVVRKKLGITTDAERIKDDWMAAHGTKDYGDVDVDLMGAYAVEDVRYTALAFLTESGITEDDWQNHDMYMRNTLHLIGAEARGVMLNLPLLKDRLTVANEKIAELRSTLQAEFGATQVNLDDDQDIMRTLHAKNLHSAAREQYGETKYVFDDDFLCSVEHPLAQAYWKYYRFRKFVECFSALHGEMRSRVFFQGDEAGFHVEHLLSTFSKGGIPQCRRPDILDRVTLMNEIRTLFTPRVGHKFVVLRAYDLPLTLFGFYCNDVELMAAVRDHATRPNDDSLIDYVAGRVGKEATITSLLWRNVFEGSGVARLEQRCKAAKIKGMGDKKVIYRWIDDFAKSFPGFALMKENLAASLKAEGCVRDRFQRVLAVDEKSRYRSHSILIQSSNGSILSYYLDLFCRLAAQTDAHLLIAHEKEFVFEVPFDNTKFAAAAFDLTQQRLINPHPAWAVMEGSEWRSPCPETQDAWKYY
jgi:hypothetical protein